MPTAAIVIPAHNEATVLGGLLDGILVDAEPGEFLIVVACNGCTDDTERIARCRGAEVVSLSVASKVAALNAADAVAGDLAPRIYIDADVSITTADLRAVVRELTVDRPVAASPRLVVRTTGRPAIVRGFYHVFVRLPWVTDRLLGSGFYGMSKAGRARFTVFPDLINDDLFVRGLFADEERVAVSDAEFQIEAPHSTVALIRAKARVAAGVAEMGTFSRAAAASDGIAAARPKRGGSLKFIRLLVDPRNWWPLGAYAFVRIGARLYRIVAGWHGDGVSWGQDLTTRGPLGR